MIDIIIHNAKIITCNARHEIIDGGYIAVKNSNILKVGLSQSRYFEAKTIIDAKERIVTPGLIDCHTHVVYYGDRSSEFEQHLEGVSYQDIIKNGGGILHTMKNTREASFIDLERESLERVKAMYRYGVTSIEIKSGYGLDVESELKILKVAKSLENKLPVSVYTTFLGAHTVPPEYKSNQDGYIDHLVQELLPQIKKEKLADFVDAFCEKDIAFNTKQVKKLFTAAKMLGFKLKLHAEQLSNQGGALMASRYGACSVDHLEYLPEEDCIKLHQANKDIVAVLLPGAFYFLKETKKPPIKSLRKTGIKIAVGTDSNPGTSPFLSLPLMMNMACIYFGLTVNEAFRGITINAAQALNIDEQVGSLEAGKKADIVLWNTKNLSSIIYNSTHNFCHKIIKNGKICTD